MKALSDKRIPMVASTATADSLAGIPGLLRPAPTNKRQARAAAAYAKDSGYHTALLVQDVNKKDTYPTTLADAFVQGFEDADHRVLRPLMNYDSDLGNVDAAFALQLANICAVPTDIVYFAGRGRDLAAFVGQMANRLCQDRPVHILTGDDNVPTELLRDQTYKRGLAANVDVVYTDLADPKAWAADKQQPQAERKFMDSAVARFLGDARSPETCFVCAFGESSLIDDDSILSYDAVYTATTAMQRAASLSKNGEVDANMVLQTFMSFNRQNSILGASGTLSYDNSGEASDKVVPLMKRLPDGTIQFMALQGS
jgi:ABC-type branched-subunit amino acid transport system substrate-binding protein